MRLLLDTQILLLLFMENRQLNREEKAAIETADQLLVSAVSLFELRIKMRAERRRGLAPTVIAPADAIAFCEARRIELRQLAPGDTAVALRDDTPHGDPFDEMLVAHAQALGARLLTRDEKPRDHPLAYRP